jgi:hypothetical protein
MSQFDLSDLSEEQVDYAHRGAVSLAENAHITYDRAFEKIVARMRREMEVEEMKENFFDQVSLRHTAFVG